MKILFFILSLSLPLFGGTKEKINALSTQLKKASTKQAKSERHFALSLAYLEDQEQDKAFKEFLLALEEAPSRERGELTPAGRALTEEAFTFYLENEESPAEAAEAFLDRYGKRGEEYPEALELSSLVAAAYGNLGSYERFFKMFYASYLPTSFLSYKTRGMLELRLAASAPTEEERRERRKQGEHHLTQALLQRKDPSLYRVLLLLAKERKDDERVEEVLGELVASGVKVGRREILFYVQECVAVGRKEWGEALVKKSRESYAYSRAAQVAEEYLKDAR